MSVPLKGNSYNYTYNKANHQNTCCASNSYFYSSCVFVRFALFKIFSQKSFHIEHKWSHTAQYKTPHSCSLLSSSNIQQWNVCQNAVINGAQKDLQYV